MTEKEFFVETLKYEFPRFEKVLREVGKLPKEKLEAHRLDPKSRSTWELIVSTFGGEGLTFPLVLKTGKLDFSKLPAATYASAGEVADAMKKAFEETGALVTAMSEADWASEATIGSGDPKTAWKTPKKGFAWGFLLDLIHHRGQLSTHLRPLGLKVPAIYGPSADEKDM